MKKPELLSPAGTLKKMHYAFAYGADAVYAGQPRYSLRVRNNDFQLNQLDEGIRFAHEHGKKFYIASNIAPHNNKLRTYLADMAPVLELKPDALIMSDPGLIMMIRDNYPDQEIHLSVQSNVVNYASVEFWKRQGIGRIILSRELSLDEIAEIKQKVPDMELEVFVHGALCIAYSGRCLLSGYINWRDPNQGACTNACRWEYNVYDSKENDVGDLVPAGNEVIGTLNPDDAEKDPPPTYQALLEDASRPGRFLPAYEDEHGTYIMNSKDLMAIEHLRALAEIGVDSVKIEGRTKSHYYAARVSQIYRQAIDDAAAGKELDPELVRGLNSMATRGFTDGFLRPQGHEEMQNYGSGISADTAQKFVGELIEQDPETGDLLIDVKNKIEVGDTLELMDPAGNHRFTLTEMFDNNRAPKPLAPGNGHKVRIPFKGKVSPYALLLKDRVEASQAATEAAEAPAGT